MNESSQTSRTAFLVFICVLALTSCLRIHLLDVPLERDEGEYAYSGQLILQGVAPFSESYNMKMPGIYVAYAAILACFGQTSVGIHFGLLLVNIVSAILLFFIGKRLYSPLVGCASACAFASLSLSSSVLGLSANAEHFVVLFALLGTLLLLDYVDKRRIVSVALCGVSFGTCVLMKQHGALFAIFGFLCVASSSVRNSHGRFARTVGSCCVYCGAALVPFLAICLWLWHARVFGSFWFWTFTYAHAYVSQIPLWVGAHIFSDQINRIIMSSPLLWIFALAGLVSLFFEKAKRLQTFCVVLGLLLSFVAICPGLYFREHYFIFLLPVVSLLSGKGFVFALSRFASRKMLHTSMFCVALAAAVGLPVILEKAILFESSPMGVSRLIYGPNPFPESCIIADSLRSWTSPQDRIAVVGSEPQIYFYAHRRSASGYIYTYALMEKHPFALHMQQDMIRQIEAASPRYLVYVNVEVSWLTRRDSYTEIFKWFNEYQQASYGIAGIADIISAHKTVFAWGKDALNYSPQSSTWIAVFRRKPPTG